MGRFLSVLSTGVVTAVLTSAFWVFYYNIKTAPAGDEGSVQVATDEGAVQAAGEKITVDPEAQPPVTLA